MSVPTWTLAWTGYGTGLCVTIITALITPQLASAQKLGWKPPLIPMQFSVDNEGHISVSKSFEFVTPVGTFSIEQEYTIVEGYAYVVFRDRHRGRDTVFQVPGNGHVELKTTGMNRILVQPDLGKKQVVIEVARESLGTVEASVVPGEEGEVMRLDLGGINKPYLVLKAKGCLLLAHKVFGNQEASLDSVKSVEFIRTSAEAQTLDLAINWKPGLGPPIKVSTVTIQPDALIRLVAGLKTLAPHVTVIKDIACINLGLFQPTILLRSDKRLIVNITFSSEEIPLDSVAKIAVEHRRWEGSKDLVFYRKSGAPEVRISHLATDQNLVPLTSEVEKITPNVQIQHRTCWFTFGLMMLAVVILAVLGMVGFVGSVAWVVSRSKRQPNRPTIRLAKRHR